MGNWITGPRESLSALLEGDEKKIEELQKKGILSQEEVTDEEFEKIKKAMMLEP